ncbi:hypothetical protein EVC24_096 [Rhizobium phage RHph_I4]|nr:hypothetical protein EVC24_096 [Rhizobium phage RHph_I4]
MEELFEKLYLNRHVVGSIGEKRLFLVLLSYTSFMVALENDGCFVVDDITKPVFATDLMGAGFDFLTAPAVVHIIEELRQWLVRDPMAASEVRLLEKRKDD